MAIDTTRWVASTLQEFDAEMTYVLNQTNIIGSVTGTNTLKFSSSALMTKLSSLSTGMTFQFIVQHTNTTVATITINNLSTAYNIYYDTPTGSVITSGNELVAGATCILQYDAALNNNAGGFHIITPNKLVTDVGEADLSRINRFRNGTFDTWQRGTPVTVAAAAPKYTSDGWIVQSSLSAVTVSQVAGRQLTRNALQIFGAASTSDVFIKQRLESWLSSNFAQQTITVQGWMYNGTGAAFNPTLMINYASVVDTWTTSISVVSTALSSCTNAAWTQLGYTFIAPQSIANGLEFIMDIGNAINAAGTYIQLAEFDIRNTPGYPVNVLPPIFSTPDNIIYPHAWILNQRYLPGINTTPVTRSMGGPLATVVAITPSTATAIINFSSQAMIAPTSIATVGAPATFLLTDLSNTSVTTLTGISFQSASQLGATLALTTPAATLTANKMYTLGINVSTSAIVFLGTEL